MLPLSLPKLFIAVQSPNLVHQHWGDKETQTCPNNFHWECSLYPKSLLKTDWPEQQVFPCQFVRKDGMIAFYPSQRIRARPCRLWWSGHLLLAAAILSPSFHFLVNPKRSKKQSLLLFEMIRESLPLWDDTISRGSGLRGRGGTLIYDSYCGDSVQEIVLRHLRLWERQSPFITARIYNIRLYYCSLDSLFSPKFQPLITSKRNGHVFQTAGLAFFSLPTKLRCYNDEPYSN